MIKEIITKPNKAYDRVKEPWRLLIMIGLIIACIIIGYILTGDDLIGYAMFGVIGLYRIAYTIIAEKEIENKRKKE